MMCVCVCVSMYIYGNIICMYLFKKMQRQFSGKSIVFSTNVAEQLEIYLQNNDLNSHLMPYAKINSKYITDLNIKPRIIKILV